MKTYLVLFEVSINGWGADGNKEIEAESKERAIEWATERLEENNTNNNVVLLSISAEEV